MLRRPRLLVPRLLVYFDSGMVLATFALGIQFRGAVLTAFGVSSAAFKRGEFLHLFLLGTSLSLILLGYKSLGLYQSQRMRSLLGESARIVVSNLSVFLVLLAIATLRQLPNGNLAHLVGFIFMNCVIAISVRMVIRSMARKTRSKGYNFRHLVVLATKDRSPAQLLQNVLDRPSWGYRVLAVSTAASGDSSGWDSLSLPGQPKVVSFDQASTFVENEPVDEIWVDGLPVSSGQVYEFIESVAQQGVVLRYILPRNYFPGMKWNYETLDNVTTLTAAHSPMDDLARLTKRAMDVVIASAILMVSLPLVMAPLAIMLYLEPGGRRQVLFRQERVGLNGRLFDCFKFRSMIPDAEKKLEDLQHLNEMEGPAFKIKEDPRITKIGAFIRKFSLDEFPQFFNVLRGDMSLVGPRPPIPSEVNLYERNQKRRLSVKPGITGLWQVSGRNDISDFGDWVNLDLQYIDQWSLALDFKILVMTIPAVFKGR